MAQSFLWLKKLTEGTRSLREVINLACWQWGKHLGVGR